MHLPLFAFHHLAMGDDLGPALASILMPAGVVAIVFYYLHQRNKMAHETLRAMIERGQPVTPETIAALKLKPNWSSQTIGSVPGFQSNARPATSLRTHKDFRSGVILSAVGVGLLMFVGRPGWIVLFLGLAFLFLSQANRDSGPVLGQPSPPTPPPVTPTPPSPPAPPVQPPQ